MDPALLNLLSTATAPTFGSLDMQHFPVPDLWVDSDSHSTSSGAHSPAASAVDIKPKRRAASRRDPQARREQNRNAQRAFRDRKERRLYELETRCHSLESLVRDQREANARLQQLVANLRLENGRLRSRSAASSPSPAGDAVATFAAATHCEPIFESESMPSLKLPQAPFASTLAPPTDLLLWPATSA